MLKILLSKIRAQLLPSDDIRETSAHFQLCVEKTLIQPQIDLRSGLRALVRLQLKLARADNSRLRNRGREERKKKQRETGQKK